MVVIKDKTKAEPGGERAAKTHREEAEAKASAIGMDG